MGNALTPHVPQYGRHKNLGLTSGQQWALLAALLAIASLWPGRRETPPGPADDRTNWDGFLALAYGGICDRPGGRNITPQRFREHMEAIAKSGYRPIALEEARAFLLEGAPLPEKAVLLTFDDGRKDTAEEAEKVLGKLRFPAAFFLRLEPIERSDHFFVTWHAVERLAATGRWAFGAKGYRSIDRIPTEDDGRTGLFLTSLAYLPEEGRCETPEEWERRIVDEMRLSADRLLSRIPGSKPIAFVFPSSDDGKLLPDGGAGLRSLVAAEFPLSFGRTGYGFNHWRSDPQRLTRLVVSSDWTGADLVRWLDAQGARRERFQAGSERDWVLRHGSVTLDGARVVLAPAEGRGAEAWLAGTEHWRCVRGQLGLRTEADAQAWLYLRGEPGRSFLRLGWTGRRVEVQARTAGGPVRRIAKGGAPEGAGRAMVSFDLTDRRIRFSIEGGTAPERSFPVPSGLDGGMAGLGVWDLDGAKAPVVFDDLRLEPRLTRGRIVDTIEDVRALEGASRAPVDVISPRWYRVEEDGGGLKLAGEHDPALVHLAAFQGASLWPLVELRVLPHGASLPALAVSIEDATRKADAAGVILDLRPSTAGGLALDPGRLRELVEAISTPVAVIPARGLDEVLGIISLERLSWIAFLGAPPREVPPERVLLLDHAH